jgi:ABC-type lipoprotein release transport system permease subunit
LKIFPAPDPEDVVWSNIGVTTCEKITRKFLTFTITLVILVISFVIVYSLSSTQAEN